MYLLKSDKFSIDVTSYDLLKSFALLTMIIDHLGYYFFPEQDWFRVIGRCSAPIWMFLIGYAKSRDISSMLIWGAFVLLSANFVFGMQLFALNILFTIIIIRVSIDYIAKYVFSNHEILLGFLIFIPLITIYLGMLFEYGGVAFMLALLGYIIRNKSKIGWGDRSYRFYFHYVFILYVLVNVFLFEFDNMLMIAIMSGSLLAVFCGLYKFSFDISFSFNYIGGSILSFFVKLMGRRSLEIYIIHLLIFKLIHFLLGINDLSLFNLRLFT